MEKEVIKTKEGKEIKMLGRNMEKNKYRMTEEIGLCYFSQFPKKVKEQMWFFKKMNNKKGIFLRSNAEINKVIRIYNFLINDLTILVKISILEKRKEESS